jgi:hypothetical protein
MDNPTWGAIALAVLIYTIGTPNTHRVAPMYKVGTEVIVFSDRFEECIGKVIDSHHTGKNGYDYQVNLTSCPNGQVLPLIDIVVAEKDLDYAP